MGKLYDISIIKNLLTCSIQGLNITQGSMGSVIYYPRVLSIIYLKQKKPQYIQHINIQNKSSKHSHHHRCQCSLAIMVHTNQRP